MPPRAESAGSVSPDMMYVGPAQWFGARDLPWPPGGPAARRGPQAWGVRLGLVRVGLTVPPSPPRDTATRSSPGVESENGKQWAGDNVATFPKISSLGATGLRGQ